MPCSSEAKGLLYPPRIQGKARDHSRAFFIARDCGAAGLPQPMVIRGAAGLPQPMVIRGAVVVPQPMIIRGAVVLPQPMMEGVARTSMYQRNRASAPPRHMGLLRLWLRRPKSPSPLAMTIKVSFALGYDDQGRLRRRLRRPRTPSPLATATKEGATIDPHSPPVGN